jgi:hypothetical protein
VDIYHFDLPGNEDTVAGMIADRSYSDILAQLREFDSYLASLGVTRKRLCRIITNIEEIHDACSRGREAALALERDAGPVHFPELIWSLTEGNEWAEIFSGIREHRDESMCRLLRKAMRAPVDPRFENSSTHQGRDTTFELYLGARFSLAGSWPTLGGAADISLDRSGFRLYVECKRPQYERNIRTRTFEAYRQLLDRFQSERHLNPVGVIAVSASKVLSGGTNILFVDDERQIEPTLAVEANRIRTSCFDAISCMDSRVVGFICHIFTPVLINPPRKLTVASQPYFFPRDGLDRILPISHHELRTLLASL